MRGSSRIARWTTKFRRRTGAAPSRNLTAHLREGRVTEGFVDAVARCGDLLARAAPPDGGGNDLPDNLIRLN